MQTNKKSAEFLLFALGLNHYTCLYIASVIVHGLNHCTWPNYCTWYKSFKTFVYELKCCTCLNMASIIVHGHNHCTCLYMTSTIVQWLQSGYSFVHDLNNLSTNLVHDLNNCTMASIRVHDCTWPLDLNLKWKVTQVYRKWTLSLK
jgi:hypothetical protein